MKSLRITESGCKFPPGWHEIIKDFIQDLLVVEYLYGDVLASVRVNGSSVNCQLHVWLLSEAPSNLRVEATEVLDQIQHKIIERSRSTCWICGNPANGAMHSNCGAHGNVHTVTFAALKPLRNTAWTLADFHMQVDAAAEDVIRALANNQRQIDAATAFVQNYHAPAISQMLAQAHSLRATAAIEEIVLQ